MWKRYLREYIIVLDCATWFWYINLHFYCVTLKRLSGLLMTYYSSQLEGKMNFVVHRKSFKMFSYDFLSSFLIVSVPPSREAISLKLLHLDYVRTYANIWYYMYYAFICLCLLIFNVIFFFLFTFLSHLLLQITLYSSKWRYFTLFALTLILDRHYHSNFMQYD